jgi:hypothetical protein
MGHSPKMNIASDMLGSVIDAVRVTFGASGAPTLVDNGKTGLFDATTPVVKAATGRYTFQLAPNYYAKVVAIVPTLSAATTTGAVQLARYLEGSYNATTGQFEIDVTAAAALVDPTTGTGLDLIIVFQRYSNL